MAMIPQPGFYSQDSSPSIYHQHISSAYTITMDHQAVFAQWACELRELRELGGSSEALCSRTRKYANIFSTNKCFGATWRSKAALALLQRHMMALENAAPALLLSHMALEKAALALLRYRMARERAARALLLGYIAIENAAQAPLRSHSPLEKARERRASGPLGA